MSTIPLLSYAPSSQNQRVIGFEVAGEEFPKIFSTEGLPTEGEMNTVIYAAYRQIFHEQQMLASHRQVFLESQLRAGQISVKDFIRGLLLSDSFRRLNFEANNNYRFVELCVQRVLGRAVYNDREKLAWSIVLATKGIQGFVDQLLDSDEYENSFGDNSVPFQRRRILPQRELGTLPFERMARYGLDYRDRLPKPTLLRRFGANDGLFAQGEEFTWEAFVERVNWPIVSGLLVLLFLSSAVGMAISAAAIPPAG
ncbi:MAG: phycobilisome rod-core linker polypeptide [Cyanobacteria bacterium P01_H01_bin.15]